jgi:hypothetical protein
MREGGEGEPARQRRGHPGAANPGRVTQDKRYTDAARRAAIRAATQLSDAPEAMPSILANWGKLSRVAR